MAILERHPISALFGDMTPEEFTGYVDGLANMPATMLQTVWMYENMVLDGWHAYLASEELGRGVRQMKYEGDDPLGFAYHRNVNRRQLSQSQKAMIDAKIQQLDPKYRKATPGRPAAGDDTHRTMAERSDNTGVSISTLQQADAVLEQDPALAQQVEQGQVSVSEAASRLRGPRQSRTPTPSQPDAPPPRDPLQEALDELAKVRQDRDTLEKQLALWDTFAVADASGRGQKLQETLAENRALQTQLNEAMAKNRDLSKEVGTLRRRIRGHS